MTLKELKDIFHPYGKIITSRILFDNVTGISKGVGFVRFDKKSEAEYAIEKVHGTTPTGFTEALSVKFANSPGARDRAVLQQMASNLTTLGALTVPNVASSQLTSQLAAAQAFLPLTTVLRNGGTSTTGLASTGGGPMRHTSQVARFRYSPLGVQSQTSLAMPQLTTSASDLFTTNALLQMAAAGNVSTQAQLAALAAGAQVAFPMTTTTQTAPTIPRSTSPSGGFTIIVANLGNEVEESLLWRLFGSYGAVLSVRVSFFTNFYSKLFHVFQTVKDSTDRGRSFGLVTMASYEDAFNAVNSLNGASISGRTLQVSFALSETWPN